MDKPHDLKAKAQEVLKSINLFVEDINGRIKIGDFEGAEVSKMQDQLKSLKAEKASLETHLMEIRRMIATEQSAHESKMASEAKEIANAKDEVAKAFNESRRFRDEADKSRQELSAWKERLYQEQQAFNARVSKFKELAS